MSAAGGSGGISDLDEFPIHQAPLPVEFPASAIRALEPVRRDRA